MLRRYDISLLDDFKLGNCEGVKTVRCGAVSVILLPSEVKIPQDILKERIHVNEFQRALAMGSATRREEYLRARFMIHEMLSFDEELVSDPAGFIHWPHGWMGSLTHKKNLIGLTLFPTGTYCGVGIDIEETAKVHEGLSGKILCESEVLVLNAILEKGKPACSEWTFEKLLALVFSFKESVFKAVFPLGRKFFSFDKFHITSIDTVGGAIEGKFQWDASPFTSIGHELRGFFIMIENDSREWVLTSVTVTG